MSNLFFILTLFLNITINILTIVLCTISLIIIYKKWNKNDLSRRYIEITGVQFALGLISGVVNIIAKQEVIVDGSYIIWNFDYFNIFGKGVNILLIYIVTTVAYINTAMPVVVLISRNWIIIKNKSLETQSQHLIILLAVVILAVLVVSFTTVLCFSMHDEGNAMSKISENDTFAITFLSPEGFSPICRITSVKFIVCSTSTVLFFNINCIVFTVHYRNYKKYMNQFQQNMTEKTRKMNIEFARILYLQSLTPVLITGVPIIIFTAAIFLRVEVIVFSGVTYLVLLVCFVPAMNAIFFIILPLGNRKIIQTTIKKIFSNKIASGDKSLNNQTTKV
uniref:G_PROTEIN_RECEP_F1_2 domain-containing protein n=1 Tax=Strongyloides papillosus TaxID=174720 RepID=A0A0N5BJS8_STREA